MKLRQIALWSTLLLASAACSNDDSNIGSFSGQEMQIVPSINEVQTRVGMDNVADMQAFMLRVSGSEAGKYDYYAAVKPEGNTWKSYNVAADGTVGDALQMLWASVKNPVMVAALYKNDEVLSSVNFGKAEFEVVQDQRDENDFKKGDYLYMAPTEALPTMDDGKVAVNFSHLMSKISLKLTLDYQFNELPGTEQNPVAALTIGGTHSKGNFNIDDQTWDYASVAPVEVQLYEVDYTSGSGRTKKAAATYECLLLPQTVPAGGFSVNITINGNKYTWTSGEDITLESNYKYELPIKVGKDYITAGNILVSDWENGEALDGETDVVTNVDVWDGSVATALAGGSGTKDDPYQIATGAQLAYLAQEINDRIPDSFSGSKYFVLTQDIDLNNLEWTSIGFADYKWDNDQWIDGAGGIGFGGLFDGQGHVISNLKINRTDAGKLGLFGWLTSTSDYAVKNLTIRNASISGAHHAGILAGALNPSPSATPHLYNVHVSGTVTVTEGYGYAGGMIGDVSYLVANGCSADVKVTGNGFTGGMVGSAFEGSFENCTVRGTVNGSWTVGGFAGVLYYSAKAKNCVSYANVKSNDWNVGGFAGYLEGFDEDTRVVLEGCSAQGDVNTTASFEWVHLGGFGGGCTYLTATDCSFTGKVTANIANYTHIGSFIGDDKGNNQTKSCWYDATKNANLVAVSHPQASSSHDIKAVE